MKKKLGTMLLGLAMFAGAMGGYAAPASAGDDCEQCIEPWTPPGVSLDTLETRGGSDADLGDPKIHNWKRNSERKPKRVMR